MKDNSKFNNLKGKKRLFIIITICLVILLTFFISEILLRILPIPGVQFNVSKYDDIVGHTHYPNSVQTYRNARGDYTERKANQWGFLDREHQRDKKNGIYRIGFFGDSYAEVKQVPLEQTYFRLIEDSLKSYNVECLAFGDSGYSTLQSYLVSKRWPNFFDLDLVVYVFCENDLGDQIKEIKKSPNIPYGVLTENGFQIDYSFRQKNKNKEKLHFKIFDYLTARSLVFSTIAERIKLLNKYGIKVKVTKEDMMMATKVKGKSKIDAIPNQNDLPSTWPDSLKVYAEELCSNIIIKWRDEIINQQQDFLILYVPRDKEFGKETKDQDSWKRWLRSLCVKQNIKFIDPTADLLKVKLSGNDVFYDHFTKEGHVAFANAFVKSFIKDH